jgi:peptidyl-dipeptidase Dcp
MTQLRSLILFAMILSLTSCTPEPNPLLTEWDTPFGVPPFSRISIDQYRPAFEEGMQRQRHEIDSIAAIASPPTVANTVEALDRSGALLTRVDRLFSAMLSSMNSDSMQAIAEVVLPRLSEHNDAILLNALLFERIRAVYEQRDSLALEPEQRRLLREWYTRFVRGGALLGEADKARMTAINGELASLTLKFSNNILAENNRFTLVLDSPEDLAGLPDPVIAAAAAEAAERGMEGRWVFTLQKPSLIPFLQYADRRDLRKQMFTAYIERGNHNDSLDTKQILARIVNLRIERAHLLGFPTHAAFVLDETMAKTPEAVYTLLQRVWPAAQRRARREVLDMQKMIVREGGTFELEPWDWWYYAEKVKNERFDLDEEMLRPYFELDSVRNGAFAVATKLYGITFVPRSDIPVYHEDVQAFEVRDEDGSHIGILFVDYFPRASKSGGAWMGAFRKQYRLDGKNVSPVIYNVGNFTKPTSDQPSLLRVEEVETLFHEFGHALHGLLSQCTYQTLSGTDVARDFVELPSQIMENWALEPEVLRSYARHYQTGEPIPDALIEKIKRSGTFNQGFKTTEYLAASFLDMDWHTLDAPFEGDPLAFEMRSMNAIGLIREIVPRYRSTYFSHIFAGDYSAGYYSYLWAEVLDADAFEAFKETGDIFDHATARAFREEILARGGTDEAMTLYRNFRGKEPSIEPLLRRRGLE